MRLRYSLAGGALAIIPSLAFGQAQPTGSLWRNAEGAIWVTECPPGGDHDRSCRGVAISSRDGMVPLGAGYVRVSLLWSRRSGGAGPDALVLGDYGGSGGDADLFAVTLSPRMSFRKLGGERFDTVAVRPGSADLHLSLPFDIEYFNGAPHAGAIVVPLPAIWTGDDVAIDVAALTRRRYSRRELHSLARAMAEELRGWADDRFPAPRLYAPEAREGTPVTARGLVGMMLSGHADQARDVLDRAWPGRTRPGKGDFWVALCAAVVRAPFWKRFGLARLPNAALIERAAGGRS